MNTTPITTILSLLLSTLSIVFVILSFAFNRKDKAVKETKEESSNIKLIEYRLGEVEKKLDQILDKFDKQENDFDKKIKEEFEKHILEYHSKGE